MVMHVDLFYGIGLSEGAPSGLTQELQIVGSAGHYLFRAGQDLSADED